MDGTSQKKKKFFFFFAVLINRAAEFPAFYFYTYILNALDRWLEPKFARNLKKYNSIRLLRIVHGSVQNNTCAVHLLSLLVLCFLGFCKLCNEKLRKQFAYVDRL